MNEYINYYDLLGVPKTATSDEIKKAYRKQMMAWHPDKNKSSNASEISAKLNEAKEILLDSNKRNAYDEKLNETKKKVYENVSSKKDSNSSTKTSKKNVEEEKTYTKWQYFIVYLKHYNVSVIRKIIAFIFVVLETVICCIWEIINILLAYFIFYTYNMLYCIGMFIGFGFLGYALSLIILSNTYNIYLCILYFSIGSIILFLTTILTKIYEICVLKIPILISKTNMFLFKKAIGYK